MSLVSSTRGKSLGWVIYLRGKNTTSEPDFLLMESLKSFDLKEVSGVGQEGGGMVKKI